MKYNRFVGSISTLMGVVFFMCFIKGAEAADFTHGDTCSVAGSWHQTNDANAMDFLICNGTNWITSWSAPVAGNLLRLDNDPAIGNAGCLRYNGSSGRIEFAHDCTNYAVFGEPIWETGAGNDIYYTLGTPQVGIGTASPNYALDVSGVIRATDHIVISPTAGATTPNFFDIGDLASVVITSPVTDDVLQFNGTNWVNVPEASISDMRMKYDIHSLEGSLQKLTSLNGYSYKLQGRPSDRIDYGVSAQEIAKIFPELVRVVDRSDGTLGVDYEGLIAPMIEAIKEQQNQIDLLRAEIDFLKEKVERNLEEL